MQPSWSNIKARGRMSSQTGAPFNIGEKVVSILYKSPTGELERVDMREAEGVDFKPQGEVLGRWVRDFKDEGAEGKAQGVAAAESAEGLLWSLVEGGCDAPEAAVLKQFLALWLERKRILRPQGPRSPKGQQYRHPASERELWVDWVEPAPELAEAVQKALNKGLLLM